MLTRALIRVFWVILLGLSAYRRSQTITTHSSPASTSRSPSNTTAVVSQEPFLDVGSSAADDYTLFAAIWTFLALIPLTLTTFNIGPPSGPSPLLSQPVIALVLEALTLIFWFASFIAVAVYVDNTYWVGPEGANIVNCERAVAVFGAFEW